MDHIFLILQKHRQSWLNAATNMSDQFLNTVPQGYNNNILWNLGHMVAVEQMLTYGLCKHAYKVDEYIIDNFKKNTRPTESYSQEQKQMIFNYLENSIPQLKKDYEAGLFTHPIPFISKTLGITIDSIEGIIAFNLYHEGLHTGVIQKYIQILK